MDKFLFIKNFDKDLYSLCCEIVKLQNEHNIDALIKCRQVLEYLTTKCGASEHGLFARIRELNQNGTLDAYITSLFNKVKKYGDGAVHIQKIEDAVSKETELKRLQRNIGNSVDALYEILIWFEIKICNNEIKDALLDDGGKRLAKKLFQKQENSLIDPLVINSFIPPDAEENVDYRERDVFETREEYTQRFQQYQKLISEQKITIGYIVIDNYDEIAGVALPRFYFNKNLNINGVNIDPPSIDALVITKNNFKAEYIDNEFEIVVNLQIKDNFYSPIELDMDTLRIQVSDSETCPFEYIDFQNSVFPKHILPIGTAYPIRNSYNIDTNNLSWECHKFSYLPQDIEIKLNTIVDRNIAKDFCLSGDVFKIYGVLYDPRGVEFTRFNVRRCYKGKIDLYLNAGVNLRLLANQKFGCFYIADNNEIANADLRNINIIQNLNICQTYNEYQYTPFYAEIEALAEELRAAEIRTQKEREARKARERSEREARKAREREARERKEREARERKERDKAGFLLLTKLFAIPIIMLFLVHLYLETRTFGPIIIIFLLAVFIAKS